jgi:RNA polymerase sigma factor (sigma-70 family)
VRSAGAKTWAEIKSALTDYLEFFGIDLSTVLIEMFPDQEVDHQPAQLDFKELIESLCLPTDVIDDLRRQGTVTIEAFASLPLCQVIRIEGLTRLTEEDWSGLTRAMNARGHVRLQPTIPPQENLTPDPSLLSLGISKRSFNCLLRAEINDLKRLSECALSELIGLRHFVIKSLVEVLKKLRIYLDSEKASTDRSSMLPPQIETCVSVESQASDDVEQNTKPSEQEVETAETSLAELVNDWLASLPERNRNVLRWRYGLEDGQPQTLEQVGQRLGLTRERVRQIEARAVRRLDHPVRRRVVQRFVDHLQQTLTQAGGLATEAQLGEALAEVIRMHC